jgi:tetratricopeptide (TPR) repeat protein
MTIVLAATGWSVLLGLIARRTDPRLAIAGSIVLVAWQAPGLVRSVAARTTPDPRIAMAQWIEQNVDPAMSIATEASGPLIDAKDRAVYHADILGRSSLAELQRDGVHYLVSTARERMLPSTAPESLRVRKAGLLARCREVWRSGEYAIYEVPAGDSALLDAQRAVQDGRFTEALHITEAGLERDPENGLLWLWRGQALQGTGDSRAVDAYERARQLRPDDPVPLYGLGNLALGERRWEHAFAAFAEAGRIAPEDPTALLYQSTALGYWAAELAGTDSLQTARAMMEDALVRARAAAVLARGSSEIVKQEERLR